MKAYVKPELFVESYELSQHIATCGIDVNSTDGSCNGTIDGDFWPGLGGTPVFSSECETPVENIEGYCYTNGTTVAGRLFNS
ncbi:MAG: hypothetical protein ACI3WQ_10580 [Faecousia sp.]